MPTAGLDELSASAVSLSRPLAMIRWRTRLWVRRPSKLELLLLLQGCYAVSLFCLDALHHRVAVFVVHRALHVGVRISCDLDLVLVLGHIWGAAWLVVAIQIKGLVEGVVVLRQWRPGPGGEGDAVQVVGVGVAV